MEKGDECSDLGSFSFPKKKSHPAPLPIGRGKAADPLARELGLQFCLIQDPKQQVLPALRLALWPYPGKEVYS